MHAGCSTANNMGSLGWGARSRARTSMEEQRHVKTGQATELELTGLQVPFFRYLPPEHLPVTERHSTIRHAKGAPAQVAHG